MHDPNEHSVERLSMYLDGDLGEADAAITEKHLAECGTCRDALVERGRIVAEAGQMREPTPPRDLWPGIAAAISLPIAAGGATVIPLPTAGPAASPPRGVFLTRPQMAAAAVILMLVSVTATLMAGPGLADRSRSEVAASGGPASAAVLASESGPAPLELADEVGALQAVLEEARPRLDPETVRIIERNLSVVDRAIEDSRRALVIDPANPFLEDHLARAWERKRDYLQEAARVVEWMG